MRTRKPLKVGDKVKGCFNGHDFARRDGAFPAYISKAVLTVVDIENNTVYASAIVKKILKGSHYKGFTLKSWIRL